jgi:hypothetical protein
MPTLHETLAALRPSSTFVSVRGYRSAESGELADYQIAFHMSYGNALRRSIEAVEAYVPADDLEIQAKNEVLASYQASLDKVENEPLEVVGEHYDRVLVNGEHVKGIKIHRETGKLHLFGLLVRKTVREAGNHKPSNKRPLTVAKDKLRKLGPVSRFRQFIFDPAHVECIAVERMEIAPE